MNSLYNTPQLKNCISCSSSDIHPTFSLSGRGVPHDTDTHNVVYDYQLISRCSTCHNAQLEAYSHDCWSMDEDWDMFWLYGIEVDDFEALLALQKTTCNSPLDASCDCSWHVCTRLAFNRKGAQPISVRYARSVKEFYWLAVQVDLDKVFFKTDVERGLQWVVG